MYRLEKKVGFGDVGENGKMSLSAMVDLCQKCCGFQLDACETTQEFYRRCNATTFLLFRQMDIYAFPAYGEDLIVETGVFEMKLSYGLRNTIIRSADGKKIYMASYVGGATVDKNTGKPAVYPRDLHERLPLDEKYLEMEYLSRKVKEPKDAEPEHMKEFPVYRYMIDENCHVNNAKYVDVITEYLPDGFEIGRFRIAYMKPAKYGDIFCPVRYQYDDKVFLSLKGTDGETYVNCECTKKA